MKHKKLCIIIAGVILVILVVYLIVFLNRVLPKYKGGFSVESYSERIELYKTTYTCNAVDDWFSAYKAAYKIMMEEYPNDELVWYNTVYAREVYYDESSDYWFVYIWDTTKDILDGEYSCCISSDGTAVSCWP